MEVICPILEFRGETNFRETWGKKSRLFPSVSEVIKHKSRPIIARTRRPKLAARATVSFYGKSHKFALHHYLLGIEVILNPRSKILPEASDAMHPHILICSSSPMTDDTFTRSCNENRFYVFNPISCDRYELLLIDCCLRSGLQFSDKVSC